MPVYVLDKLKRTVSSQKIADVAELDGALVLTVGVTESGGTKTINFGYRDASNADQTLDVEVSGGSGTQDSITAPIYVEPSGVGSSASAITLAPDPAITAYSHGDCFYFQCKTTNSANATVNVSGLGARQIKLGGSNVPSGAMIQGHFYGILYGGAAFQIIFGSITASAFNQVGTASGNLVRLGSGGVWASGLLPRMAGELGAITKPTSTEDKNYSISVSSSGTVTLAEISGTGVTVDDLPTVPVNKGGTGATTESGARTNLGLGTAATADTGDDSGEIPVLGSGGTLDPARIPNLQNLPGILDVASGGTGTTTTSGIRSAIGLGFNAQGNLPKTLMPGILDQIGGIDTPSVSADTLYFLQVSSSGVVSLTTTPLVLPAINSRTVNAGEAITNIDMPAASGGEPTYTYSLHGTPPTGIQIVSGGPAGFRLSGTPTALGAVTLTFRVTDSASTVRNSAFTITVVQGGNRYCFVVDESTTLTSGIITGGTSAAVDAGVVTLPTWTGNKLIGIAQPEVRDDLTYISPAGFGNAFSSFTKQSSVTISSVDYEVWLSNEVQGGEAISGTAIYLQ